MSTLAKVASGLALASAFTFGAAAAGAADKNWTPPQTKIYAQVLSDQTMAAHPELLSVTIHGVPPGLSKVYTMFAGSYPDRIGNADDPDDIDVQTKGITIVDPRWHRTADNPTKFVVLLPLRDAQGQNIGLIVYAFKHGSVYPASDERKYFKEALDLRDALQARIPSYQALFNPA